MTRILMATVAAELLAGCSNLDSHNILYTDTSNQSSSITKSGFANGFEALEAGDNVQAEALLKDALSADPEDPYTLLSLGVASHRLGRHGEALNYYRKAAANGANAPIGDTTAATPIKGEGIGSVRDLALYNMSRYGYGYGTAYNYGGTYNYGGLYGYGPYAYAPYTYGPGYVTSYESAPVVYDSTPVATEVVPASASTSE